MPKRNVTAPKKIFGRLDTIVERGAGTVIWAFREEMINGELAAPRPLQKGDFLRVFNDAAYKKEIWSGAVELDFTACKGPLPRAPHITAQQVKGVGPVHGVQKNADPEKWGEMFVLNKPAVLSPRNDHLLP